HRIAVAGEQEWLECDGRTDVVGQTLDEERLTLDDAVLLTAGLDDCVGHCLKKAQSVSSASAWADARERRRPPLRPRRRGREDSASSSPSSSSDSSASATGASSAASTTSGAGFFAAGRLRARPFGFGTPSSASGSSATASRASTAAAA